MKEVYIAAALEHERGNLWRQDSCDLAMAICEPLLRYSPQGFFVASPSSALLDGQANYATLFADRLGLAKDCLVHQFNNGDLAGASALAAAAAFIQAGWIDSALVLGVAKVSDWEDHKRYQLADQQLDSAVERQLGLDYLSLNGLLASHYLNQSQVSASLFHHLVAKNHSNACRGGATYLSYPALAEELARDLQAAPPLGRSDIAPLLDGAVALLVSGTKQDKESVALTAIGYGVDTLAPADRKDMLSFASIKQACRNLNLADFSLFEIENATSILEVIAMESLGLAKAGAATEFYTSGGGLADKQPVINSRGGQQGLGNLFGLAALEQGLVAFEQLNGKAGDYQLALPPDAKTLGLCLSGLGGQSYGFVYEKVVKSMK